MKASSRRAWRNLAAAGITAALLCAAGASVHAHDFWLEPRAYQPGMGGLVGLHLMVGEEMIGDPIPRDEVAIERFVARHGGKDLAVPGQAGGDPAGILRVPGNGLLVVGYQSHPRAIELPRAKFEAYLGEEGLDAIRQILKARRERPAVARERFSRCAKALLSNGTPSGEDQPIGLMLELIAGRNPYMTAPQQDVPFTLLYKGLPHADALVIAINRDDPSVKLTARSDPRGMVHFQFPRTGVWLVKAVHMIPMAPGSTADWESFWASLTFELPAASAAR